MSKSAKKFSLNILYAVASVALVLAVWSVAAQIVGTKFILPTVGETFSELGDVLESKTFWSALGGTFARSGIGFAAATVCFFALFFFCSVFEPCAKIFEPIISALRTLPIMAVSLILAIWAGGYAAPVIVGVLVAVPYMYASVKARNATVEKELKEICVLCGAGRVRTFAALWFPHAAAGLPETLSSGFSFCVKAVVSAEILMQTANSIGQLMNLSKIYLETAMLIAFVFSTVILTVAVEYIMRAALSIALKKYGSRKMA